MAVRFYNKAPLEFKLNKPHDYNAEDVVKKSYDCVDEMPLSESEKNVLKRKIHLLTVMNNLEQKWDIDVLLHDNKKIDKLTENIKRQRKELDSLIKTSEEEEEEESEESSTQSEINNLKAFRKCMIQFILFMSVISISAIIVLLTGYLR